MATSPEAKKPPSPPYASFLGFVRFTESLRGDGHLPGQIDRGVLSNMSGSGASAMTKSLEALGFIDATGKPTQLLKELLQSPRGDGPYQSTLRSALEHAYPYLFNENLDLRTATTIQVQAAFRAQGVTGSTVSKAIAFFLAAAKEAGVSVSKYVRVPPMAETGNKKRSAPAARVEEDEDDEEEGRSEGFQMAVDLHPALLGVLRILPAPGQPMTGKERERFMTAFAAVLQLAHPDKELI